MHSNKATAEEVFHPEDDTRTFDDAGELQDGLDSGELVEIPTGPDYGYRIGSQLGELTGQLGVDRKLYESLRPEALATLIYMTARVEAITGKHGRKDKLTVTSAVRDQAYQDALVGSNPEATRAYSLHTTGYSFDILRNYRNGKQAQAFQFVLDRLSALGVIDYAREPQAIHVTVSNLAKPLLDEPRAGVQLGLEEEVEGADSPGRSAAPLLAIWVGSRLQESTQPEMGAIAAVVVVLAVCELALVTALSALNERYDRVSGRRPPTRRPPARHERARGARPWVMRGAT